MNKFDLCANSVTLDYDELVKAARVGVRYSLEALEQRLRSWRQLGKLPTNLDAEWMQQDAEALATATTALHYLDEGNKRDYCKVTNKLPFPHVIHDYNKITLIKVLREMLAERGYRSHDFPQPGLRDCKEMVEALVNKLEEYEA